MIIVRPAEEQDIEGIRDIFLKVYGKDYPYKEFYDTTWLKRAIFNDHGLMLAAVDTQTNTIAGTASVLFEFGAHSDLVGEFGRLAVDPDYQGLGLGKLLMDKRLEAIQNRLHLGLVMCRVTHPFSQKISLAHQFVPFGFLPLCYQFSHRESFALLGRHFGNALALRKNNPRVIPEVSALAHLSLPKASLPCDVIIDEDSASYPPHGEFTLQELSVEGYPDLLRIERGRVRNREIFGSMRLEYGFFKLQANHATYLLASDDTQLVGAIGFTLNNIEHSVRVFELISFSDPAIRFLLTELERKCRDEWEVEYIEIDVSAHAPRMQRTLLELNFLPAAYIPAMVFHEVERLDIIRMVRLSQLRDLGPLGLLPEVQEVADVVMRGFQVRAVIPKIAKLVAEIPLFQGMSSEQRDRLAGAFGIRQFKQGTHMFKESEEADNMFILLEGRIIISTGSPLVQIGQIEKGETVGELSFLSSSPHSATATAQTEVETALLTHQALGDLVRRRPDIGVILYRNLAAGIGKKLLRSDLCVRDQVLNQ
jgi:GNAT superfamily N-acetyltransferase